MGQFHDCLGKVTAARVNDVFDSERGQQGAFGGVTGGGDDGGSEVMGDLNGGHAYAAGPGVDEDHVTLFDAGDGFEGVPCGHEDDREGGGFLVGEIGGHRAHVGASGQRVSGETEDGEAEGAVAGLHVSDG